MQVTERKNEGLKREFEVVLKAEDINKKVDERLKNLAKTIKIPGFRPGKVPVSLVKKKHGTEVLGEILQNEVANSSEKILEERELNPALQPKIEVSPDFAEGEDLKYSLSFEIYPDVPEVDLAKIKVTRNVVDVTDKELEDAMGRLREAQTEYEPVKKSRAAKKGDAVLIDFEGKVDGVAFEGGTAKDFHLILGSGQFIPGYEEQLIGAKKGESKIVKVTFPENYGSKKLAGKESEFSVEVKDVLEAKLPEVNDEFAGKFGMENVEKLKEAIKGQIARDFETITGTKLKKELFDALDKAYKFPVPEGMVEMEFGSIKETAQNDPETAGADEKEKKKQEKEFREIAERRVRLGIILADIGRKNALTVTEDEVRRAVFEQARNYPGQEQKVIEFYQKNPGAVEQLKGPILEDKVVEFITGKISVTDKKVSSKDLLKFNETGE